MNNENSNGKRGCVVASFNVRNYLEEAVSSYVNEAIQEDPEFCGCDKCRLDVIALALNDLKPKYVVTNKGYVLVKTGELEAQFRADTVIAVKKAMKIVKENPRHAL